MKSYWRKLKGKTECLYGKTAMAMIKTPVKTAD